MTQRLADLLCDRQDVVDLLGNRARCATDLEVQPILPAVQPEDSKPFGEDRGKLLVPCPVVQTGTDHEDR